jgi:hypothetical protein
LAALVTGLAPACNRPFARARILAEQERTAQYDRETAANARAIAEETPWRSLGFLHISRQQPLGLGFEGTIKLHP